jgi:hypothetical protein
MYTIVGITDLPLIRGNIWLHRDFREQTVAEQSNFPDIRTLHVICIFSVPNNVTAFVAYCINVI